MQLGEHTALLAAMPDSSADIVYFDPMFRKPGKSASSFDIVRQFAHVGALTASAIAQAKRVARRRVVVMDQAGGKELERLGMSIRLTGQRKRFGVIETGTDDCRDNVPAVDAV